MNSKKSVAGIILAAGMSRRFGKPKQLSTFQGKTFLESVVDAALLSNLKHIVLVLGFSYDDVVRTLGTHRIKNRRLTILKNEAFRQGMSRSLQLGLKSVSDSFSAVMFLLGDQPLIRFETINILLEAFSAGDKDICVPVYGNKRGNPTIFSRRLYPQLLSTRGDSGGRNIIRSNPDSVQEVDVDTPDVIIDIDRPEDLDRLVRQYSLK
jgi:molybdenum cofactor cytidylyltransferase